MKYFKLQLIVFAVLATIALSACYGPSESDPIVTGKGTVQGKVFDENGIGIGGVYVECEGYSTFSSPDGSFKIINVPNLSRNLVNFTKSGFATNQKLVKIKDLKSSYVEAVLFPIGNSINVNASNAFSISSKGAKVDFQANSLKDESGNIFSGQATINLTYFDPTGSRFNDVFPGEFEGIGLDGRNYPIISYGFIDVEIFNGNKKLQLANGKPATVSMPIPTKLLANAPSSIPLWHYDTEKGQWIELGSASKSGSNYVGTVEHFSKINCDMKYEELSEVRGKVTDNNGVALENALVKLSGVNFAGGGQGYTDEKGEFHFIRVKASDDIKLIAYYSGFLSVPLTVTTASNGQVKDNCNLIIPIDSTLVSGWEQIKAPAGYQVQDMQFINENTGWIIGSGIFRTDDGGSTWTEQLKGGGSGTDSMAMYAIHMIDINNGWAVGSKVYYTTNGGIDWEEKDFQDTSYSWFQDVFFIDNNTGWIAGNAIWKTTDAGITWTKITSGGQQYYFNIAFTDAMNGFVSGYGILKKTTDGGITWTEIPVQNKYGEFKIFLLDNNIWFLSGGREGAATVYYSNDGGTTLIDKSPDAVSTFNDIFFINSNEGWVVGNEGIIFHTTDAGNTWKQQFNKSNAELSKVFFVNNLIGWTAGTLSHNKIVVLYTKTGGETP